MSEEDGRKMKTSSSSDDKKKKRRKKRKRRKKLGAPHTPQQAALAELNPAVKPPEPAPRGQTPKRRAACKKSKEPPREPPLPLASDGDLKEPRPAGSRVPPPTPSPTPPDAQVSECLRWEGALQDPRAEEERLEAYRANRRRRYAAQRDAPPAAPLARTPAPPLSRRAF
ncbi:protein LIAT1 [Hippocampus comes]|uniref:protein LIAT1 n=1 Tax=Hippocampus comes TaxID=109280 RepID=UPI00094EDC08|nr:PREDICTED: protein LIAT1 [Hippocampus comes]